MAKQILSNGGFYKLLARSHRHLITRTSAVKFAGLNHGPAGAADRKAPMRWAPPAKQELGFYAFARLIELANKSLEHK